MTGSRIERAGFDQPTPTTVIGDAEIRLATAPNLQQVLNEQPQIRNSVSPTGTIGNTSSGTAPVDLRGLGSARTLTLVNGRRFVGDNNLNFVPTNLVQRVELVTGGASAAWGSGAVAGVVNIILNDDLDGLTLGAQSGISSRGDGFRYGFDGSFGTQFAGGRGHFMIGAEYVNDEGISPEGRAERPWLGAGNVNLGGGRFELQPDVNDLAPITRQGTILAGSLAGQLFNADGSLRAATEEDYFSLYDLLWVASPLERVSAYARASYDIGENVTVWADAVYGRAETTQPFFPDFSSPVFAVSASNPFLSPTIQAQLAGAGETSLTIGRLFTDTFFMTFDAERETKEFAVGIEGSFGNGWEYDAHFSHGEVDSVQRFFNSSIPENFARAIDAVEVGGQIVCAVNADADPTNDDPACVAFNPFGIRAASPEAMEYVSGTQYLAGTTKLDSAAIRLQGDLFSLWAGPVTIAVGAEARWEEQEQSNGPLDEAGVFGLAVFTVPTQGGFDVQEGFVEALVPLLDTQAVELDLNGAARYSDYSLSGGIWSWKLGGTARLFDDILLRATRSRDIRAPSIGNLFSVSSINVRPVVDLDSAGRDAVPGYNPNPTATILSGGNQDLVPEVSETWTVGGSISPSFLRGLSVSVDYYDIKIGNAITTPSASDVTAACAQGDAGACARVVRDATGTIDTVYAFAQNIARFQTNGVDIEAAYQLPLALIDGEAGTLRFRALATYVDSLVFETGFTRRDVAGDVGDPVIDGVPHWRGTFSAGYQSDSFGIDTRVRYVGGGQFDSQQNIINGDIEARTYVDLGVQFRVWDRFELFGNVRNVFDVDPPLVTTTANAHYEGIGRFFQVGTKVKF
ncbi:TonB-dependent receptor plug domain-containing protein [Sphingosinithalassobacter sp. LHW66-3]|uniref:TonB-dependent receptor plug domain-containing protein n=1 Tax=Sphingosinithalassobacter sp. LHW66-3 TaxID=3424718 RepID=UPI003D6C1D8C